MELDLIPCIWAAGALQFLVASANVPAARMFRYRDALRALPGHVAEVFVVQNIFIMIMVVGMGTLSFTFADELAGGSQMGRAVSGFLAVFWFARLVFQLCFYDRELRRRYRFFDVAFIVTFVYLVVVYTLGAVSGVAHSFF